MKIYNPFTIQSSEYFNLPEYQRVSVRFRFFIFLFDILILALLSTLTVKFLEIFTQIENKDKISIIVYTFYSIVFIIIEYYFDGSLVKILFGIRNLSNSRDKIGLLTYFIKHLLKYVAIILGFFYASSLLLVLLIIIRIFGGLKVYYNYAIKFAEGSMKVVWYDSIIEQNVIFIKK